MALPKLNAPKYELTIPSTGKRVEFRPYTVKEEKILLIAKSSEDPKQMVRAIRDMIVACTYEAIDIKKLTMFDFEYIFLQLRGKSVGETAQIRVACTKCTNYSDFDLDVANIEVTGDIKRDMKVQLTNDIGVVLKWPSFDMAEKYAGKEQTETLAFEMLLDCIESIYDKNDVYPAAEQTTAELNEFIDSLSSAQFKKLSDMLDKLPQVSTEVEFKCMSCGHMNKTFIKGLQSFF